MMRKNKLSLSIVIPAYNEEGRLPSTLKEIKKYLRERVEKWQNSEVLVVADGCSDGTENVVSKIQTDFTELKLIAYAENKGKGFALKTGVAETTGHVVVFADADGATPIGELDRLAAPILAETADVVMASRRAPGAKLAVPQPFYRILLGNAFSLAVRLMLGFPFLDTQCGFKVFKGDVARKLFAEGERTDFAIDIELIHNALKHGYVVEERGIEWRDVAESTVHPIRDGMRMLAFTTSLFLRSKFNSKGSARSKRAHPGSNSTSLNMKS